MTVADIGKWRTIRDVAISDDGQWASYGYQQRRVDDTLFVKPLPAGAEQKIPRASRAQFSDDSKWIAYFVAEPIRPNDQPAQPSPDGGPAPTGPAKLELRNLATNAVVSWDNVGSFAFSKGSNALMVRKARAGAGPAPATGGRGGGGAVDAADAAAAPPAVAGTDMILRHLRDGTDELIGSVSAAEFNRPGTVLAYTVSSTERDGNGLHTVAIGSWSHRDARQRARRLFASHVG